MSDEARGFATIGNARLNLRSGPPKAGLKGGIWQGVAIDELSAYSVTDMTVGPRDHHVLSVNLADHPYVRAQRCGRVYESAGLVGEAGIMPAGVESTWDGKVPPHITVRLPPDGMVEVVSEIHRGRSRRADIANNFRLRDPFIANMAAIFSLELGRTLHPAQDLLVESLVVALQMHLIRGYTDLPHIEARPPPHVPPAAVRRALAFIEDQPNVRITLDELASAAGLSRFHFSRVFRNQIGMSPAAYVEHARLERAKVMIRLGQLPLADIAYILGFADQSHFARRFRRHEGVTPSEFARDHASRRPPRREN